MRALFIFAGIELLERFHWMLYIFGGLLAFTAVRMAMGKGGDIEPGKNLLVRLAGRCFPVSKDSRTHRFFVKEKGKIAVTPLFLTLLVVESSDVIFALDSIPAILAVTRDPFIVYTSNIFAILGLRSLYYLLANVMEMFVYLKIGISFILAFVGIKMIISDIYTIPIQASLAVIALTLLLSIAASLLFGEKHKKGNGNSNQS
jgi:tellurite resistance protein TerC